MFKRYTTIFHCTECKYVWKLNFWQWLWTIKYHYVKCPRCGVAHWLQAKKVR